MRAANMISASVAALALIGVVVLWVMLDQTRKSIPTGSKVEKLQANVKALESAVRGDDVLATVTALSGGNAKLQAQSITLGSGSDAATLTASDITQLASLFDGTGSIKIKDFTSSGQGNCYDLTVKEGFNAPNAAVSVYAIKADGFIKTRLLGFEDIGAYAPADLKYGQVYWNGTSLQSTVNAPASSSTSETPAKVGTVCVKDELTPPFEPSS